MKRTTFDDAFKERWFRMPVTEQISNIGGEVARAIRWKNRGDRQKARNFCNKAIDFWLLTEEDPKNKHRVGEFDNAIEELQDYFIGENTYQTTDEVLTRYYDAFLYRDRSDEREKAGPNISGYFGSLPELPDGLELQREEREEWDDGTIAGRAGIVRSRNGDENDSNGRQLIDQRH